MKSAIWKKALQESADPARASHFLELLLPTAAGAALEQASAEQARIVAALLGGSQAQGNLLVAHPEWLAVLTPESLGFPRRKQGLRKEVDGWLKELLSAADYNGALRHVRQFKELEMLRIAARDLARLGKLPEIIQEISDVADVCLDSVWQACWRQLADRFGQPYHQDVAGRWMPTPGCVFGLGKLGGQELNYSSDVDVIFVYAEEGSTFKEPPRSGEPAKAVGKARKGGAAAERKSATEPAPRGVLSNHQFFNRLAEAFISEISRLTEQGTLYRIDLRLRPEGDAGPLSRSLASYENYYAQWGQTWERMMLIKARGVAGDQALAAEFLEMIQPFRYSRSINEGVFREVAAMKDRIEHEVVKAGELDRNVKLGRGGIREVEFIVQAQQVLHAGRQPFLQGAQTLPGLSKLAQYELISNEEARLLAEAYCFLRDVEHRLQMEGNLQTHTIPLESEARERLARLMGFGKSGERARAAKAAPKQVSKSKSKGPRRSDETSLRGEAAWREFAAARQAHTANVRQIFDRLLKRPSHDAGSATAPFPRRFEGAEADWKTFLARHAFKDVDKAFRVLREFVEGPGYVHVSPRTSELAYQILPKLFELCSRGETQAAGAGPQSSEVALAVPGTGGRVRSHEAPLSDPDRVVRRLDGFISAYGARATLFELWNSNPGIFILLALLFDRSEFLADLAIRTPDLVDELVTSGRLRQRKSAEETLRDLRHGLEDADQHLWLRRYHQAELMRIGLRDILGLADFEQYLAELSGLADACLQYALEVVMRRHKLKAPPFVIIGLGKLGGAEIDYGSDLDIVFVADAKAKDLPKLARLATEVMDLVSARTEQGMLFHTDARLRPDGEKGLLVNTLKAYEAYYRERALLWEIQTLTRTRPVAGDRKVGEQFQSLAGKLTNFRQPSSPLAAYSADWRKKIHDMRLRIEKERTPRGKDELAIKTGRGGLIDAEFIAQNLCLANGWQEANTLRALERGREAVGTLPDAEKLIANYRQLRRIEGILRRWSYEGETVLPADPAPYYRVSVRCGFPSPEAFREALAGWRRAIREVYLKVFPH